MKNSFFTKNSILNALLIFILIYTNIASALEIQAFGISSSPFENAGDVTPCYLDLSISDIDQINQNIRIQSNINTDNLKTEYETQFKQISQSTICQFHAKQLGIKKLPAIVFDTKYVVYGINNIDHAKLIFLNYQDNNL